MSYSWQSVPGPHAETGRYPEVAGPRESAPRPVRGDVAATVLVKPGTRVSWPGAAGRAVVPAGKPSVGRVYCFFFEIIYYFFFRFLNR